MIIHLISEVFFGLKVLLKSSKFLHAGMVAALIRSTMSFYESTPTGRILNRVTRDINAIEAQLPQSFKAFSHSILAIINSIVIISYSTPWVLILFVPMAIVYIFILVCYLYLFDIINNSFTPNMQF